MAAACWYAAQGSARPGLRRRPSPGFVAGLFAAGWAVIGADVARGGRGVCGHGAVQVASSAGGWRAKPGWRLAWRPLVAMQRKGQLGQVCVAGHRRASWWGCAPVGGLSSGPGAARGDLGVCGHGAVLVASSAGRWRDKPGWRLAWRPLVATQRKARLGRVCVAGNRWAEWRGCSSPGRGCVSRAGCGRGERCAVECVRAALAGRWVGLLTGDGGYVRPLLIT